MMHIKAFKKRANFNLLRPENFPTSNNFQNTTENQQYSAE